jgi:hypothetical protein
MSVTAKSLVIVSLLGLAACAQQVANPEVPATGTASKPAPETAPIEAANVAEAPPAPAPRPEGEAGSRPDVPATTTAVAPAATVHSFPDLVGRTSTQVRAAMGVPDRIIDRPPARIWRYDLPGCSLDLFLFPDVSSGAEKALTWSAEPKEAATSAEIDPRCAEVTADG